MRSLLHSLSVIVALSASPYLGAEVLTLGVGEQGNSLIETPRKGSSKAQIQARYGAPLQKIPAVGKPPISQWVYTDFTVYFEYDHVVHSVLKHQPGQDLAPIDESEDLSDLPQ